MESAKGPTEQVPTGSIAQQKKVKEEEKEAKWKVMHAWSIYLSLSRTLRPIKRNLRVTVAQSLPSIVQREKTVSKLYQVRPTKIYEVSQARITMI